jgi:hypothetical protein
MLKLSPLRLANAARACRLVRREDGKAHAKVREQLEGLEVDRRLRQPHPFGPALKAGFKITNAPGNLCDAITPVGQRHDHMIVHLCDGRTMAGKFLGALPIGREDRVVNSRRFFCQPGEQGGTKVKAHLGIIVDQFDDAVLLVENSRHLNLVRSIRR